MNSTHGKPHRPTLAHWISENSDNNVAIDKAVSDMNMTAGNLAKEQQAAPQAFASAIQPLKEHIQVLNLEVTEAENKVKSLGGKP